MGRPGKKPNFDADLSMKELIVEVSMFYGEPYDDRLPEGRDHITLRQVAEAYQITLLKARKILIAAGKYSTSTSRLVHRYAAEGKEVPEIMKLTGLSRASVHSYLPYSKLIYNMDERSVGADRKRHQRRRERICRVYAEGFRTMPLAEAEEKLWEVMEELQGCVFHTARGLRFKYKIKGGELFVDRKKDSITKATVFMALRRIIELNGSVRGPKKLGTFGASYLYPIFRRIGMING